MPNFDHIDKFKTQDHVVTPHGEGIIISRTEEFADVDVEGAIQKCSLMRCVLKSEALERDGKVTCWDLMDKSDRSKVAFESGVNMPNISALWEDMPEQHQNLIKGGAMSQAYDGSMPKLPKGQKATREQENHSIGMANRSKYGRYGRSELNPPSVPKGSDSGNRFRYTGKPAVKSVNGVTLTDIVKAWRDGERMSATRKAEMEEIINYAIDAGYVGMDKDATSEGRGWTTGLERNWDNPTLPKGKKPTSDQKIRTMGISAHQSRNVEGRKVHDKRQDPKNRAINPVTMPKNKASALQGTYLAKGLRRIG